MSASTGFFSRLSIATKIQALLACIVIIVMAISIYMLSNIEKNLVLDQETVFANVLNLRAAGLDDFAQDVKRDLVTAVSTPSTLEALKALDAGFAETNDATAHLQNAYITENPNILGEKNKLNVAKEDSSYNRAHALHHAWISVFMTQKRYYDFFLINPKGDVVYTYFKELDFATNMNDGKWKDSNFAKLIREVIAKPEQGKVSFVDFAPYAASNNMPASFMATPIFENGVLKGVLAFQIPSNLVSDFFKMSSIIKDKTSESLVVGPDLLTRSESRYIPQGMQTEIMARKMDIEPVRRALKGETGVGEFANDKGVMSIYAFRPVEAFGVRWAAIRSESEAEALEKTHADKILLLIQTLMLLSICIIAAVYVKYRVTNPLSKLENAMGDLAGGKLATTVPYAERGDEVGKMARAVDVFKQNALRVKQMEMEQDAARVRSVQERKEAMNEMANSFEGSVKQIVDVVSSAAVEMEATAKNVSMGAEGTSKRTVNLAHATAEASQNVSTVAAAAEELSSSIAEITRQVQRSAEVSQDAVKQAGEANTTVKGLAAGAQKIGDVVNLINDIAEQINLLALNATIEAARAGDAGKGFAVVASEVKSLANQTAKATEEIGGQIRSIQSETGQAVEFIQSITKTISHINEISTAISAAVEEQGAATKEIARSVQEAARNTSVVSESVGEVSRSAQESGASAAQMLGACGELARQADVLNKEVDKFIHGIRES